MFQNPTSDSGEGLLKWYIGSRLTERIKGEIQYSIVSASATTLAISLFFFFLRFKSVKIENNN